MKINEFPEDILDLMKQRLELTSVQNGECIECYYKGVRGYSQIAITKNKTVYKALAHRLSYVLNFGEIPNKMHVCHKCDNPRCINPQHLFVGTAADNMVDMANKKRRYSGKRHHSRKLSFQKAEQIRALHKEGMTQRKIANMFGVGQSVISDVLRRVSYVSPEIDCKIHKPSQSILQSFYPKAFVTICLNCGASIEPTGWKVKE